MSGDTERVTCPDCGDDYARIGIHWAKSSECDAPVLSPEQRAILDGLLLCTASLHMPSDPDHNPKFTVNSTRRWFLDWVDAQFPVLSLGVTEAASAEESARGLWENRGSPDHIDPEDIDASAVYRWQLRTIPALEAVYDDWFNEEAGGLAPPSDVQLTPLVATTVYGRHGKLRPDNNTTGKYLAALPLPRLRGGASFWEEYLQRFSPRVMRSGDTTMVNLKSSAEFFAYLDSDPVTGPGPLPGGESRWPSDERPAFELDASATPCPTCGIRFSNLATHWSSSECPFPEPTGTHRALIDGLLLAGGSVYHRDDADRTYAAFGHSDREFLEWAQRELGVFATQIRTREGETVTRINGKEIEFGESHLLITRSHPVFEKARRRWYPGGGKNVPKRVPDDLEASPMLLRAFYAHSGFLNHTPREEPPTPRIHVAHLDAADRNGDLIGLFEAFDPAFITDQDVGRRDIAIRDGVPVFDYIGGPPTDGVAHKWRGDVASEERV